MYDQETGKSVFVFGNFRYSSCVLAVFVTTQFLSKGDLTPAELSTGWLYVSALYIVWFDSTVHLNLSKEDQMI